MRSRSHSLASFNSLSSPRCSSLAPSRGVSTQNLPIGIKRNERPFTDRVNQVSPYGVNFFREIALPTILKECFDSIPIDLGAEFKTLTVVQDEARVRI